MIITRIPCLHLGQLQRASGGLTNHRTNVIPFIGHRLGAFSNHFKANGLIKVRTNTANNYFPNLVIIGICNINIPGTIHGNSFRIVKLGVSTSAIGTPCSPTSRQRSYHAFRSDLPNLVIKQICHIYIPRTIHGNSFRIVKLGVSTSAIGKARLSWAFPRQRGYHAFRSDLTNLVIIPACHINIPGTIHCNAFRIGKLGIGTGAIGTSFCPTPCQRGDNAFRSDLTNPMIIRVSHINIFGSIRSDTHRIVKLGIGTGAISAT